AMDAAGADYEVIIYPGVKHSFTNPAADEFGKKFDMPLAYNAEADRQSWAEMEKFLMEAFNQNGD
ncbi:MAG: dienelactone hydrolase family protein, partial [Candidatus Dadabacteria bacterium]|nr:dienelactone hydrolase family protein [Candidatus Dadabacteria bacterium]